MHLNPEHMVWFKDALGCISRAGTGREELPAIGDPLGVGWLD